MKAVTFYKYCSPENLRIENIPTPVPQADEMLVRIRATAINDFDWSLVRGKPYVYRLIFGLTKPKTIIPGIEMSGTIEAVGTEVKSFKVGDHVYGDLSEGKWGTYAEYACVKEKNVFIKPDVMSFEEAAALPHAAMLAKQGLIDIGKIQQGESVLINGAGGGVGIIGLQLAKLYGAEVTGVDSADKLPLMISSGFDHVIDYKKEDFTKLSTKYDLILDAKTNRSASSYERVLKKGGRYVTVGGHLPSFLNLFIRSKIDKKNMHLVALKPNKDLAYINDLFIAGKIKPVIDGPHKLEDAGRLLQYFGEGKHMGKVVISIP